MSLCRSCGSPCGEIEFADPGWPWVYYLCAQALAELGRTAEAQVELTKGLGLNPMDELREQMESLDLGR